MNQVENKIDLVPDSTGLLISKWPVLIGLLFLYIPTLYDLFTGIWRTEDQAHGPIILVLSFWLLYKRFNGIVEATSSTASKSIGWLLFFLSLALYILGRSQSIIMFELGSLPLILSSLLLILYGSQAFKALVFPLFFMLFMVPLPGPLVSALTLPMKTAVSFATEQLLYFWDYPVARNGVILQIGQYKLLVADACAGLQTLLTLEALGLLYLNVTKSSSSLRNIILALFIIPISFSANVVRITALTLITYYFGDEAGQGFLHGFAGMTLFLTALGLILLIDTLLQYAIDKNYFGVAKSIFRHEKYSA